MSRLIARVVAAGTVVWMLGIACVGVTCACTPHVYGAVVAGIVRDAGGTPVGGVAVAMEGWRSGVAPDIYPQVYAESPQTNSEGRFVTTVIGHGSDPRHELRTTLSVPGRAEVVKLIAGTASFTSTSTQLDTVRVEITLPPPG